MKLSLETAEAFARDILVKVEVARSAGESDVDVDMSARDAAISALDEAQAAIESR